MVAYLLRVEVNFSAQLRHKLSSNPFKKDNTEQTILPTERCKHARFLRALMHGIIFSPTNRRIVDTLMGGLTIMVFLSNLYKEISKDHTLKYIHVYLVK